MTTPLHPDATTDPLAAWCHDFYKNLVKQEFTADQALALTRSALAAMIRKS